MKYSDRLNDLMQISSYTTVNDTEIYTKEVMREETELLLKKQRITYFPN
jgi:hypothetical protein